MWFKIYGRLIKIVLTKHNWAHTFVKYHTTWSDMISNLSTYDRMINVLVTPCVVGCDKVCVCSSGPVLSPLPATPSSAQMLSDTNKRILRPSWLQMVKLGIKSDQLNKFKLHNVGIIYSQLDVDRYLNMYFVFWRSVLKLHIILSALSTFDKYTKFNWKVENDRCLIPNSRFECRCSWSSAAKLEAVLVTPAQWI